MLFITAGTVLLILLFLSFVLLAVRESGWRTTLEALLFTAVVATVIVAAVFLIAHGMENTK